MPAPIRPSEICALVPSGTSSLCDRILKVFLQLPAKFCALITWMFNEDGTITDEFRAEMQVIPTGTVIYRLSTVVPTGWLLANGAEVSRTTYADLFSLLGTTYGAGNGTTTFNLPNLQDRFLYGKGTTSSIGDTGGEAQHTLTAAEIPAHTHTTTIPRFTTPGNGTSGGGAGWVIANGTLDVVSAPNVGDSPHNTLPPYFRAVALLKT